MTARSGQLALQKTKVDVYQNALSILQTAVKVFGLMTVRGQWKPAQSGLRMATMAVLDLQEHLLNNCGYSFFCPGLLTQDMVENLFSQVRMRRPVPQPLQFVHRLRQLTISQFMQPIKSSSYDFDEREYAVDLLHPLPEQNHPASISSLAASYEESEVSDVFFTEQELTTLYRMCGYVVLLKVKKEFKTCEECVNASQHKLEEPHPMSRFLQLTNYKEGAQVEVADCVYQMLLRAEAIFRQIRQTVTSGREEILDLLYNKCSHLQVFCSMLPQCHDISSKILRRFLSMRTKQLAGKVTSSLSASEKAESAFARKTTGSKHLADRF